jgi:hypothetical protein
MIDKLRVIKDLEDILNSEVSSLKFPYKKGNTIRIDKYAIRQNKNGFYSIYDTANNTRVYETFSKTGAIAVAKSLANKKSGITEILKLDREAQKWYNDCVFYKHTIEITKDDFKREYTRTRYDIARWQAKQLKAKLDRYVFS